MNPDIIDAIIVGFGILFGMISLYGLITHRRSQ